MFEGHDSLGEDPHVSLERLKTFLERAARLAFSGDRTITDFAWSRDGKRLAATITSS